VNDLYADEIAEYGEPIETMNDLDEFISEYGIDSYELFAKISTVIGIHSGSEYDEDVVSVGREWSDINDDETGRQFKQSVKDEVTRLFGQGLKCDTIEESFRC
jgi:hypothetical protein